MDFPENKIELFDQNQVARLRLGVHDDGTPYFSLHDTQGNCRLLLTLDEEENGVIRFYNNNDQEAISLGVSPDFGTALVLRNEEGEEVMMMRIHGEDAGLVLKTSDGETVWPTGKGL